MRNRLLALISEVPVQSLAIALGILLAMGSFTGAIIGYAANIPKGYRIGSSAGIVLGGSLFGALLAYAMAKSSNKAIAPRSLLGWATWGFAMSIWLLIINEISRVLD